MCPPVGQHLFVVNLEAVAIVAIHGNSDDFICLGLISGRPACREMVLWHAFAGAVAAPVVADALLVAAYYRRSGKVPVVIIGGFEGKSKRHGVLAF